jgi:hypothetical protein
MIDLPRDGEYAIVQLDANGQVLARQGIIPIGIHKHSNGENHVHNDGDVPSTFSVSVIKAAGLARIQLRRGNTTLASFAPGANAPVVSITSPTGGSFTSGALPVSWLASDADGDALSVSVDYSKDGGATWTYIGSGDATGSLNVPISEIGGSPDARIRVTASDGFTTGSATSGAFSVANSAPRPVIQAPQTGTGLLEGSSVLLSGFAVDPQTGARLGDDNLRWISSKDGDLGTGASRSVVLSAGSHTLTLRATNAAGLSANASVSVFVEPDYDGDGIPDSQDMNKGLGLSVLNGQTPTRSKVACR